MPPEHNIRKDHNVSQKLQNVMKSWRRTGMNWSSLSFMLIKANPRSVARMAWPRNDSTDNAICTFGQRPCAWTSRTPANELSGSNGISTEQSMLPLARSLPQTFINSNACVSRASNNTRHRASSASGLKTLGYRTNRYTVI
jgi:hypothetical protein